MKVKSVGFIWNHARHRVSFQVTVPGQDLKQHDNGHTQRDKSTINTDMIEQVVTEASKLPYHDIRIIIMKLLQQFNGDRLIVELYNYLQMEKTKINKEKQTPSERTRKDSNSSTQSNTETAENKQSPRRNTTTTRKEHRWRPFHIRQTKQPQKETRNSATDKVVKQSKNQNRSRK